LIKIIFFSIIKFALQTILGSGYLLLKPIIINTLFQIAQLILQQKNKSNLSNNVFQKTYIGDDGYLYFSDSNKPLHRWVAEKKLGRRLWEGEVVHHKNRDKLDNSPENLHVFQNQEAHDRVHRIDAKKIWKTV
jgi:hypothetical protein